MKDLKLDMSVTVDQIAMATLKGYGIVREDDTYDSVAQFQIGKITTTLNQFEDTSMKVTHNFLLLLEYTPNMLKFLG